MKNEFDLHFRIGSISFNSKDALLLQAVAEHGSLNSASSSLGRSYSRAHKRIQELEMHSGPLLFRTRGGQGGGGSSLTKTAYELLDRFSRLEITFTDILGTEEIVLQGQVLSRDGELATILTSAGPIRALLFTDAEYVQISLRSDSITLHSPPFTSSSIITSALNRFVGVITSIATHEAIAEVTFDVGSDITMTALVSLESLRQLNFQLGSPVVATFKATSTRAVPFHS